MLESFGINLQVVGAQIVSFIVLLFLLVKFLFRPVQNIMQQRQETIANNLANAEAQQMKAENLRKEYDAHLSHIADEAKVRLDQAMKDAEAARQRMLEVAHAEIRDLNARHEAELGRQREQLRRELHDEMAEVAIMAAAKALRAQMTPEVHAAVNDQIIRDLERPSLH